MARRKVNPLAVRAQIEAVQLVARGAGRSALHKFLPVIVANLLSVAMLSLAFPPFDAWYLAYGALVPWLVMLPAAQEACRGLWQWAREPWPRRKGGSIVRFAGAGLLRLAIAPGIVFWAANLYWLWWITLEGYAALVVYLSLYWAAATVLLRWARRRNMPLWLMLPLAWVSLEWARSYIISGFPWFYLGHTQYAQTPLIQIADMAGQYGVSFVVAMVNGLIADGVMAARTWTQPATAKTKTGTDPEQTALGFSPRFHSSRFRVLSGAVACIVAMSGLLGYGFWRMSQPTTTPGPVLGVVQQAYPIALGRKSDPQDAVLKRHLDSSRSFLGQGCDLVIWPESMLPAYVNAESLGLDLRTLSGVELRSLAYKLSHEPEVWDPAAVTNEWLRDRLELASEFGKRQEYAGAVARLTRQLQCPLLAGAPALHRNGHPIDDRDLWVTWNSALWFDQSDHNLAEYAKVHLVPFSEYVPFGESWPGLHRLLRSFVPEVMSQLEPGPGFRTFRLERGGRSWGVASPICYEGTFDRVCRKMIVQDGKKVADLMANLSNDGWFVWKWLDGRGSNEQSQHLLQYCFRAVENRVPVVRAVNTGISASIDSNGRILSVIEQNGKREMVTGAMLLKDNAQAPPEVQIGPQVLVDSRLTLYSLYGDVVPMMICAAAIGAFAWMAIKRPKRAQEDPT